MPDQLKTASMKQKKINNQDNKFRRKPGKFKDESNIFNVIIVAIMIL